MDHLAKIRASLATLKDVRQQAEPKIAAAIRGLEAELQDAIGDTALRGLPNLADNAMKLKGLLVRSPHNKHRIKWPEPGKKAAHLVLRPEGNLVMVDVEVVAVNARDEDITLAIRDARDDEFVVTDLRDVADTIAMAAELHLAKIESTHASWRRAAQLADEITAVLGKRVDKG